MWNSNTYKKCVFINIKAVHLQFEEFSLTLRLLLAIIIATKILHK